MDEAEQSASRDDAVARDSAHDQAEHLRRRVEALAADIAHTEDTLAVVYEDSARLRPHAADRLREAARQARDYAERERRYSRGERPT